MTTPDAHHLSRALAQLYKAHPDMGGEALSGQCDAFAIALHDQLSQAGVDCQLHVISRLRLSLEDESVLDENPMSHIVLFAYGQQWDAQGPDAFERWEQDWIQPSPHDEPVECEDSFDWKEISLQALTELRMQQDQRIPCETFRQTAQTLLHLYLANAQLVTVSPHSEQQQRYYKQGGCHELAIALHRRHGFDLCFARDPDNDGDCHVYARDHNGLAWDVMGARPFEAIPQERRRHMFSPPTAQVTVFSDEASFVSACVDVSQQFERPLSTYTASEIERAGAVADGLVQHPAFGRPLAAANKPKAPKR